MKNTKFMKIQFQVVASFPFFFYSSWMLAPAKACTTFSRRNHLCSGVKYQLKIPKIVTAPKMTEAWITISVRDIFIGKVTLTKLKLSATTGKKNGETITCTNALDRATPTVEHTYREQ